MRPDGRQKGEEAAIPLQDRLVGRLAAAAFAFLGHI